ncbi:MAG: efflux RND transporter periplasmic adaptor subunit [Bacteroidetes bacterium]|nr:efflux RND transporter periplasmic adaptor subunit [Bacteroidota bacterium]MCL5025905.1 efflux RND transporter periplasmic adaptor subunit [Chloroflexota bacterium]
MKERRRLMPILAVVAVVAVILAYLAYRQLAGGPGPGVITASGTIEADEVAIAAEIGGRVVSLSVDEGDAVQADQVVVQLDDTLLNAQLKQAQASQGVSVSNLNLVQGKTRQEDIDQARAALAQAQANKDGAQRALDNAIAIRDNPQDINTRIDAALAEYNSVNVDGARVAWENAVAQVQDPQDIQTRIDAAQAAHDSINVEGARQAWQDALAQRNDPQDLNQRIAATQAQLAAADSQVQQAKNALNQQYINRDRTCGQYGKNSSECLAANAGAAAMAADVQTAQANREQVKRNLDGVLDQKNNPIVLNTQVDAARTAYDTAVASKEAARRSLETLIAMRDNPLSLTTQADAAKANYDTAVAQKQAALRSLNTLIEMRDNPLTLNSQVDAAKAQLDAAAAAVNAAQAKLTQLERGATPEQIDVAKAQVAQAQAAVRALQVQKDKMTLRSPINGTVNKRSIHQGEVAAAGATLLTIIDLDSLHLTLYIPEQEIGLVQLGQKVAVSVDAFPDEVFQGQVSFISAQAEYTPRNVQTKKERVNLVFAVKVSLPNPEHRLKPGIPADAAIGR